MGLATSWRPLRAAAMVVATLSLIMATCMADDWRWGRATFYGDKGYFSIHEGSCGFGYLDGNKGTGWSIAAMPDVHYEHSGSCGRCYEVKCEPMTIKDNWGNQIERSEACYDPNKVILVTITDTCPCSSNSRWCCGDSDHLDLSWVAYDQLADRRWGVIGLKYRPAPCPGEQWDQGTESNPNNDWDQTNSWESTPDQWQNNQDNQNPPPEQPPETTPDQGPSNQEDQNPPPEQPSEGDQAAEQDQSPEQEMQQDTQEDQASGEKQNSGQEQAGGQNEDVKEEQTAEEPEKSNQEEGHEDSEKTQALGVPGEEQIAGKQQARGVGKGGELGLVVEEKQGDEKQRSGNNGPKSGCMGGSLWWLRASLMGEATDSSTCET